MSSVGYFIFFCNEQNAIDWPIAVEPELIKVDARQAVEAHIKTTVEQFKQGERITIAGFGTFSVVERAA